MKTIFILFLISIFMSSSYMADETLNSENIRITKVSENFYKIHVNKYVNIAAFTGPEGILLVDTGFEETAEELELELKKICNGEIRYIRKDLSKFL